MRLDIEIPMWLVILGIILVFLSVIGDVLHLAGITLG